jgi:hypothetical protein
MLKPLFAMADRPDYMRCKRKVSSIFWFYSSHTQIS